MNTSPLYCHECRDWRSTLPATNSPRDGSVCRTCGESILCDECGGIWHDEHEHASPDAPPKGESIMRFHPVEIAVIPKRERWSWRDGEWKSSDKKVCEFCTALHGATHAIRTPSGVVHTCGSYLGRAVGLAIAENVEMGR